MIIKTGKCAVALLVVLVSWIAINSMDEPAHYDQSLLLSDVAIPDEQNGFAVLRYLDADYDKDVLINNKDYQTLRKIIVEWEDWDPQFSERLLTQNGPLLDQIPELITRPYFKPKTTYSIYQYLPQGRLFQVARLSLLKSRSALEKGDIDTAISTAHVTLLFCEKISMDANGNMISYLIGKNCVGNVLDFYHAMANIHELSNDQFRFIHSSIDSIAPYGQDGFDKVIQGEFTNIFRMAKTLQTGSMFIHWSEYTNYLEKLTKDKTDSEYIPSTVDKAYTYLSILFPYYYFHVNHLLNSIGPSARDAITDSKHYCDTNIQSPQENKSSFSMFYGRTLSDFFMPDSLGSAWQSSLYPLAGFDQYIISRCQKYNYFSAIKISIAAKQFQQEHGKPPSTLESLIPNYLHSIPIDYFSGNPLQYFADKQWLYAEGVNHNNHDGTSTGFYRVTCRPHDKNPPNECNTKPTFPINWNDYKFYEVLHKAEAGDKYAQNELGWMYRWGNYTDPNIEKAIYWFETAAAQNSGYAMNQLAYIYTPANIDASCKNPGTSKKLQDAPKALHWLQKSHENKHAPGSVRYAEHLLQGDIGKINIVEGSRILLDLAGQHSGDATWPLTSALWNDMYHNLPTDIASAAWLHYYIQRPDLVSDNPKNDIQGFHSRLGYYYRWQAQYHAPNTYNELMRQSLEHYREAGDTEQVAALEKEVTQNISTVPSLENAPDPSICKALQQGNADLLAFQETQVQIFKNPSKAKILAEQFHNTLRSRYPASSSDNQVSDILDLDFESINLHNVVTLYLDFIYGDKSPPVQLDPAATEMRVMVKFEKQPALQSLSLLLASYGIEVKCQSDAIKLTITKPERTKPHLFTPHFITQWDPALFNGTTLTGSGHISYEDTFHYRGEIDIALPNGAGIYSNNGDKDPENYFQGDHFFDGILYGNGTRVEERYVIEEGNFEAFRPITLHSTGYGFRCEVLPETGTGTATETHYDCGDSKYKKYFHMPIHPELPLLWSYSGEYQDNHKTSGDCTVFKDGLPADTFHCEFCSNSLVKVGDVSLLPPGMTTVDLQQFHP